MRLVTWNEKNEPDLPPHQVESDCRTMARLIGRGATIIGGQEFEDRSDRASLERAFPAFTVAGAYPVPLLLHSRYFRVIKDGYVVTHGGLRGVSPHRGFSWALSERRYRPLIKPFVAVASHYVSGAWTPGHTAQAWRRDRWREHHSILTAFIARQNSVGRDVFLMVDANRVDYEAKSITATSRTLARHGLDHIIYSPAGGSRVKGVTGSTIRADLHTDHLPVVANLDLTARAAR